MVKTDKLDFRRLIQDIVPASSKQFGFRLGTWFMVIYLEE